MEEYRIDQLPERISSNIQINPATGCWEWQRARDKDGYGRLAWNGKSWQAVHRVVYELLVGPIPEDLPHLDHVKTRGCTSKACCWPAHLEPVTPATNNERRMNGNAAKTHCPAGHPYDEENTGRNTQVGGGPGRSCKTCKRKRERDRYTKKSAARTHCPRGHEYTPENTIPWGTWRRCRTCHLERWQRDDGTAALWRRSSSSSCSLSSAG